MEWMVSRLARLSPLAFSNCTAAIRRGCIRVIVRVRAGSMPNRRQAVGEMKRAHEGTTRNLDAPHLDFERWEGRGTNSPWDYCPGALGVAFSFAVGGSGGFWGTAGMTGAAVAAALRR